MVIMAVDLGHVRTGLAVCDAMEMLASPAGVIHERKDEYLIEKIISAAKEHNAGGIVVGNPKNMDSSEGESAQRARAIAAALEEKGGIPVTLWDERCTTVIAHNYLNATDVRGKKRKSVVDTVAAVIILQDYIDYRRNLKND